MKMTSMVQMVAKQVTPGEKLQRRLLYHYKTSMSTPGEPFNTPVAYTASIPCD